MSPRFVALVALSFVLSACADQGAPELTSVSVTVDLSAEDIGADSLEFIVSHPTELPNFIAGNIEVSGNDPVTFRLSSLPVATNYTLSLGVFRASGERFCDGDAVFDILDGQTTQVNMILTCSTSVDNPNGYVGVDITFQLNYCPVIEDIDFTPSAFLGDTIDLSVVATDPDNTAPLQYTWSSGQGVIADATAATTILTCATVGPDAVTIAVSDTDPACVQQRVLAIDCLPSPACGDGVTERQEVCDDGVNDGGEGECLPGCLKVQDCGDTILDGTEVCDDGVNDGGEGECLSSCLKVQSCGDAVTEGTEQCDDGQNDGVGLLGCLPGCLFPATCGDGITEAPEFCDDGVNDGCEGECLTCTSVQS